MQVPSESGLREDREVEQVEKRKELAWRGSEVLFEQPTKEGEEAVSIVL